MGGGGFGGVAAGGRASRALWPPRDRLVVAIGSELRDVFDQMQAVFVAADVTEAPVQPVSFGMLNGIRSVPQPPIGQTSSAADFERHFRRASSMSIQIWVSGDSHMIPSAV